MDQIREVLFDLLDKLPRRFDCGEARAKQVDRFQLRLVSGVRVLLCQPLPRLQDLVGVPKDPQINWLGTAQFYD